MATRVCYSQLIETHVCDVPINCTTNALRSFSCKKSVLCSY